jgi:hypothetical protein
MRVHIFRAMISRGCRDASSFRNLPKLTRKAPRDEIFLLITHVSSQIRMKCGILKNSVYREE